MQINNVPLFYCLNALEAWCLPPHFNDLNAWFLLPFFNNLDVGHYTCLPPLLPSTLILKLDWLTSDFCLFPFLISDSEFVGAIPLFYPFWFPSPTKNMKELLVSHFLKPQQCSSIFIIFTFHQKSIKQRFASFSKITCQSNIA